MIVLQIILGIIWFLVVLTSWVFCGLHIGKQKVFRIMALVFLGLAVFLSYFVFPRIMFLSLNIPGLIFYGIWNYYQLHLKHVSFLNSSKFARSFCSWIFIKEEDVLISLVFPRFLIYFAVLILSVKRRFRPFLQGIGGIDIDVQSKDTIVSIHV